MFKRLISKLPEKYRDYFIFLGPGLLLAIAAAGESGIAEAVEIGAHFGFELIWVVILTIIFKFAFANGIARYTLATGETIFDGFRRLPGPSNWGSYLVMIIYFLEMFAFGGMLIYGGIFLDYLIPGIWPSWFVGALSAVVILVLLWKDSYERVEKVVIFLVLGLFIAIMYCLLEFTLPFDAIYEGFRPNIPEGSVIPIMAMMGAVGSGLNLLLYSTWLHEKMEFSAGKINYNRFLKSVNLDLCIAFIIVGIITFLYMTLGVSGFAVSYLGHGEAISIDSMISQILYVLAYIPYGVMIFLVSGYLIMFGATLSGMDGRARAISQIIASTTSTDAGEKVIYRVCLLVFTAVILTAMFLFDPVALVHHTAAFASVMFGILGFMIIYLDLKLPEYARGSRLWILVTGAGSIVFLYVAMILEESLLTFGLPLIERLLVIGFVIYAFSKTEMFQKFLDGRADYLDHVWAVVIFGAISIYGTYRGIPFDGLIINFRDTGPAIAGLLGGPLVGGLAGVIGGLYRYSSGGWTATACFAGTVAAGIIAGFYMRWVKGRLTYYHAIILGVIIESVHILVLLPLLTEGITFEQYAGVVVAAFPSMVVANTLGILLFVYILSDKGRELLYERFYAKFSAKISEDSMQEGVSDEEKKSYLMCRLKLPKIGADDKESTGLKDENKGELNELSPDDEPGDDFCGGR